LEKLYCWATIKETRDLAEGSHRLCFHFVREQALPAPDAELGGDSEKLEVADRSVAVRIQICPSGRPEIISCHAGENVADFRGVAACEQPGKNATSEGVIAGECEREWRVHAGRLGLLQDRIA